MEPIYIFLIVLAAVLVLLIVIVVSWYIRTMNKLRQMCEKVDESESGIDVALTKRFDLLTKEVAVVKGVAKHEAETLEKVIAMRQQNTGASMQEKYEFASQVTKAFDSINVVMERYPELKATANFSQLQNQVFDVEEQLQAARRVYNANVRELNQLVVMFPSSFVARRIGVEKREYFEAEAKKREDVKIEF